MRRLRGKGPLVLLNLVLAALLFGSASLVWFNVTVPNPVQDVHVAVRGTQAAPAVSALALVAAAAALALSIAGRRVRWVVAAIIPLVAVGAVASVLGAVLQPDHATETAVGDSSGLIGADTEQVMSFWPWCAVATGLLLVLSGVWTMIVMRGWAVGGTSKYQVTRGEGADGADRGSPSLGSGHDADLARRDGIDAWDALSEGDDPTGR